MFMNHRPFFILTGIFSLIAAVIASPLLAVSFQEPGGTPPAGIVAPPLNASTSTQRKAGNFLIGQNSSSTAVFCLNPDSSNPSMDPALNSDCISNWSNLTASLGGPFVRLNTGTTLSGDPFLVASYSSQSGHARIAATDNSHAFSLLGKAANVCLRTSTGNPCTWGGAGACTCTNTTGACTQNRDCKDPWSAGTKDTTTAGIYASDGGNSSNTAGIFQGRVLIQSVGGTQGQLCLNGTDIGDCVESWDQITGASGAYVSLQAATPTSKQTGAAMTSGVSLVSSVIAGDPAALGLNVTCGDGICTTSHENTTNCSIDCSTVTPIQDFAVGPNGLALTLSGTTGSQTFSGNVKLLIVKSTGSPPTFSPLAGASYTVGQTYGNSTIHYYNDQAQNTGITGVPDDSYTMGVTNYYTAYLGSQYPQWSVGQTTSFKGWPLALNKIGNSNKAIISGPGFDCGTTCASLTVLVPDALNVQFCTTVFTNYRLAYSGACSGQSCSFVMNNQKMVTAAITNRTGSGFTDCI